MQRLELLNIELHNWTFDAFLEQLEDGVVVTPNVDHLMRLQKDREFYECYQESEHVVCDSRVVQLLSKALHGKQSLAEQIAGSDLFPAFCQRHKDNTEKIRVFLLGGTGTSVLAARKNINERAGAPVVIGGYSPPFGFEDSKTEIDKIVDMVNKSGATVLAVGVGAPKQEKWIHRHRDLMPDVRLFFAIGATIDFEAGSTQRAPRWMANAGLEWMFRIIQEPRRLVKRYFVDDLPFFWLVLKQRFGLYRNPWDHG